MGIYKLYKGEYKYSKGSGGIFTIQNGHVYIYYTGGEECIFTLQRGVYLLFKGVGELNTYTN